VSEEYAKKVTRSKRIPSSARKGRVLKVDGNEVQLSLPIPMVLEATHGAVEELAGEAGMLIIRALIDDEVAQLAGPRYEHSEDRSATRWGSEEGYVVFGGQKVAMRRPRVRAVDGKEVALDRYRSFRSDARMQGSIVQRVLRGVSTRDYAGVIDDVCDGYGIEKSSVSRHWKAATTEELTALLERRLDGIELSVIMIDGIHFHDFTLISALGIAVDGKKHVLGIWDGATENSAVVTALLENLVERGLAQDRDYLFVIDGSKALRKAIVAVFGKRGAVQRCQVHKARNVLSHLPDQHQGMIRRGLRAAWGMKSHADAKAALDALATKLDDLSPSAAASLREGLEETLTLHRLEVNPKLRPVLNCTNPIENIFARTRELCRNVKKWSSADMALRWASTMLLHAEKRFRRVIGNEFLAALVAKLGQFARKEAVA
jgi:transposase-like protein